MLPPELIIPHFARFGTEIHTGLIHPRGESKTEILFCSKPRFLFNDPESFDNTDLSDVIVDDHRYIPIVDKFKYLGSVITRGVTDEQDIDTRILKASNAFGSLRSSLFGSKHVNISVKGCVYRSVILPILLYGAECWCLTEQLLQKLRMFHRRCVRSMCNVNRSHTFNLRITTNELLQQLSLSPIDVYISQCQMRWAGHVMRMPWNRLPNKMISSWVRAKRPRGCPSLTYGRSLKKSLLKAGVEMENWTVLCQDRAGWRNIINSIPSRYQLK